MQKNLYISALLDVYGTFLSEKQRILTEHYYNDDLSLSEIAENEGITRQGVCDIIKRAEAQLEKYEEACGYCKKFSELRRMASDVRSNENRIIEIINEL